MSQDSDFPIEQFQEWEDVDGQDRFRVKEVSSSRVVAEDINGHDYGVRIEMTPRDFRKKFRPTSETKRKWGEKKD